MGHYCRICGATRPNEAFSGKGHRTHVCKKCAGMPSPYKQDKCDNEVIPCPKRAENNFYLTKEARDAIEQEEEIFDYLRQSHISNKNIARLKVLASSENPRIAELAAIVYEVALVKPFKTRRLKLLARERKDLLRKLDETGLILAHHW